MKTPAAFDIEPSPDVHAKAPAASRRTLRAGPLSVGISLENGKLRAVDFPAEIPDGLEPAHLAALAAQLAEFPICFADAPPFTREVWQRMREIPSGSAMTYTELAALAGKPRAVRAVGNACATNRLLLAIPCHRVIAQTGLGGFRLGLDWKRKLLELEAT